MQTTLKKLDVNDIRKTINDLNVKEATIIDETKHQSIVERLDQIDQRTSVRMSNQLQGDL